MSDLTFLPQRLYSHHLNDPIFETPADVVHWYGAVQAQEYLDARWTLGLRMTGATAAQVDQAFDEGLILRTHVMRPTWHFVAPADIRWLLMLTAPRVHGLNRHYYRQTELDEATLTKSTETLAQALQGGNYLTRQELADSLERQAGIAASGVRLGYVMIYAELEGVICSGPRRGKQFTYALLEERVPPVKNLTREEALAELTRRYFTSHGPATVQDFVWWSGLTAADTKAGLEMVQADLAQENVGGQSYWFAPMKGTPPAAPPSAAHLLPTYDEYTIAYKDRSTLLEPGLAEQAKNSTFWSTIELDGQIVGMWRRTFAKDRIDMEYELFRPLTAVEEEALSVAAHRYGAFYGMRVELSSLAVGGRPKEHNRSLKWD
jgi:hypothetical protein